MTICPSMTLVSPNIVPSIFNFGYIAPGGTCTYVNVTDCNNIPTSTLSPYPIAITCDIDVTNPSGGRVGGTLHFSYNKDGNLVEYQTFVAAADGWPPGSYTICIPKSPMENYSAGTYSDINVYIDNITYI